MFGDTGFHLVQPRSHLPDGGALCSGSPLGRRSAFVWQDGAPQLVERFPRACCPIWFPCKRAQVPMGLSSGRPPSAGGLVDGGSVSPRCGAPPGRCWNFRSLGTTLAWDLDEALGLCHRRTRAWHGFHRFGHLWRQGGHMLTKLKMLDAAMARLQSPGLPAARVGALRRAKLWVAYSCRWDVVCFIDRRTLRGTGCSTFNIRRIISGNCGDASLPSRGCCVRPWRRGAGRGIWRVLWKDRRGTLLRAVASSCGLSSGGIGTGAVHRWRSRAAYAVVIDPAGRFGRSRWRRFLNV